MERFAGKAYVVTGGSSGIGLAAARQIVAEGGKVLVTGSNPEPLTALSASDPAIYTIVNDAGDAAAADALAAEAQRLFERIDGALLNAGIGFGAVTEQITYEAYRRLVDINIGGPLFGTQALSSIVRDGGAIVITASIAKDKGTAGHPLYGATKGAVRSMVRGFAAQLAPRRIRVNTVSPGPIETDFFTRLGYSDEMLRSIPARIAASNPLGRMGSASEAAAVALFLLSDDASYVTGSDYPVDGGSAQI